MSKGNGKDRPVLMPERMGLAESKRNDWVVDLPVEVTIEQIQDPDYWSHVAQQMTPFDHIEARSEDGSWVAYLLVVFAERNYALVIVDRVIKVAVDTAAPVSSIKYKVDWKGPHHKFVVIRTSDSAVLQSQLKTRAEANDWLVAH